MYTLEAVRKIMNEMKKLQRRRFSFRITCLWTCRSWVSDAMDALKNDPAHDTNPHPTRQVRTGRTCGRDLDHARRRHGCFVQIRTRRHVGMWRLWTASLALVAVAATESCRRRPDLPQAGTSDREVEVLLGSPAAVETERTQFEGDVRRLGDCLDGKRETVTKVWRYAFLWQTAARDRRGLPDGSGHAPQTSTSGLCAPGASGATCRG